MIPNLSFILAFRALRLAGLAVGLGLSALTAYQRSRLPRPMASNNNGHHGHIDASTGRDVVYCHACTNEWYRDESGLTCPECHSDITEIVRLPYPTQSDL